MHGTSFPPEARRLYIENDTPGPNAPPAGGGGVDRMVGPPPEPKEIADTGGASGSRDAAPCLPEVKACAAMGLEGIEGKSSKVVVLAEPDA